MSSSNNTSGSGADPFDEFEFKPLTEGLGFHKKSVSLKDGLKRTGVIEDELKTTVPLTVPNSLLEEAPKLSSKKHSFEDVLSALEKTPLNRTKLEFTEPLKREPDGKRQALEIEKPRPVQSPFPQPGAYKNPVKQKNPFLEDTPPPAPEAKAKSKTPETQSVGVRRGAADSPQRKLIPAPVSFESAFLDMIIVTALAVVFLISLLIITKVDLSIVVANLNRDVMTRISFGVMFVAVMQMYAVISRSFFGRTIGEWTFDLQLGADDEQASEVYPFRVMLRSFVNTITGLVLLPLISAIIGRDLAGQISGVKLYRQRS